MKSEIYLDNLASTKFDEKALKTIERIFLF